jgi:hypothetical protein
MAKEKPMSIMLAGSQYPTINQLFIQAVLGVGVTQVFIQLIIFALAAFLVFRRKLNTALLCSAIAAVAIGLCWTFLERSVSSRYYYALSVPKQFVDQLFMAKVAASVLIPALFSGVLVFLIPFFKREKGRVD